MKNHKSLKKIKYQSMCNECGVKKYGQPKREMGAITVSMGICPICHKKKAIIPGGDWHYMCEDKVNSEDWD